MRRSLFFFAGLSFVAALLTWTWVWSAPQSATVLYDGAQGNLPSNQEFLYLTDPFGTAQAMQSAAGGATTLDTTAVTSEKAGYFAWRDNNPTVPALVRSQGFALTFRAQIISENHAGSDKDGDNVGDRAGFSVILQGSDSQGIEVGFWEDEIWVQEDGVDRPPTGERFTHAEGVAFDTTASLTTYRLSIYNDVYALTANGVTILTGSVRDYTAEGNQAYTTPNFIFLGDNTSSADAKARLSYVAIAENTGAPTATATATATQTAVPTNTPTATATQTAVPTNTPTATATQTAVPTNTPTSTATQTAVPAYTPTATATSISSDVPTATPTRAPEYLIMLPLVTKP